MPSAIIRVSLLILLFSFPQAVADETPSPEQSVAQVRDDRESVIQVNREAGTIDLKAKMVPAAPQWLELVATVPGPTGREHEAIVTVNARPSEVHLVLITLGLEPGQPMTHRREGDELVTTLPTGPELALSFVYEKDGHTHEVPVHEWVFDQATGETIPPCRWLFAGSRFRTWQGREYYMADEAGNIASLVNFGDDLIVRQTGTTRDTDFQQLQLDADRALPFGEDLILRIRVPRPEDTNEEGHSPASPSQDTDPGQSGE
ncbi:MAG: hypothetical protein Kow00105_04090 [Phycisphaeraceae bacterium]